MRRTLPACVAIAVSAATHAQHDESLVIDPDTGDYIVTYCCNTDGSMAQAVLEPATKVDASVTSRFTLLDSKYVKYEYQIEVSRSSRKGLSAFRLDPVSSIRSDVPVPTRRTDAGWSVAKASLQKHMSAPHGWRTTATLSHNASGLRLSWSLPGVFGPTAGPGARHDGIGFESMDLPGVATGQLTSPAGVWAFANEGPDRSTPVGRQLTEVEENDFVAQFVAAPTIVVPNPFDAKVLLERIRDHVRSWPRRQLMEQAFWQKCDALLDEAVAALTAGNRTAAASKLDQVGAALRAKYPDLEVSGDPQMAARILEFNSRYVLERAGLRPTH